MKSFRGFASGRDWLQKFSQEKRRYVFEDRASSPGHQTLVEVVTLADGAPNCPPVGTKVGVPHWGRGVVASPVFKNMGSWCVVVTFNGKLARIVLTQALTVIPETETIRVEVTGPPADIADIRRNLGLARAPNLTYKVL